MDTVLHPHNYVTCLKIFVFCLYLLFTSFVNSNCLSLNIILKLLALAGIFLKEKYSYTTFAIEFSLY